MLFAVACLQERSFTRAFNNKSLSDNLNGLSVVHVVVTRAGSLGEFLQLEIRLYSCIVLLPHNLKAKLFDTYYVV